MAKENKKLAVFNVVRTGLTDDPLQRVVKYDDVLSSPFIFRPISTLIFELRRKNKDNDMLIDVLFIDGTIGLNQSVKTLDALKIVAWAYTTVDIYASSMEYDCFLDIGLPFDFVFDANKGNDFSFNVSMSIDQKGDAVLFCDFALNEKIKKVMIDAFMAQNLNYGQFYYCNLVQKKESW